MSPFIGRITVKLGTDILIALGQSSRSLRGHRKFFSHTSVLSGGISVKLRTNNRHVCELVKGFQGQRSKVSVTVRPSAFLRQSLPFWRWLFTACCELIYCQTSATWWRLGIKSNSNFVIDWSIYFTIVQFYTYSSDLKLHCCTKIALGLPSLRGR